MTDAPSAPGPDEGVEFRDALTSVGIGPTSWMRPFPPGEVPWRRPHLVADGVAKVAARWMVRLPTLPLAEPMPSVTAMPALAGVFGAVTGAAEAVAFDAAVAVVLGVPVRPRRETGWAIAAAAADATAAALTFRRVGVQLRDSGGLAGTETTTDGWTRGVVVGSAAFRSVAAARCGGALAYGLAPRIIRDTRIPLLYALPLALAALVPPTATGALPLGGTTVRGRRALVRGGLLLAIATAPRVRRALDEHKTAARAELVVAERTELAREMHDVVAHELSVVTIQAAGARAVLRTAPERADEALEAIEGAARQGLVELRRMLATLRARTPTDDALPDLADIATLVAAACDAGLAVTCSQGADPEIIAASVEQTAYRIVQESLTNALRHAGEGARVDISLWVDGDRLLVEVVDDGGPGGRRWRLPGAGLGLVGMRERADLLEGSVSAGPRTDGPGWRVRASLPFRKVTAPDR